MYIVASRLPLPPNSDRILLFHKASSCAYKNILAGRRRCCPPYHKRRSDEKMYETTKKKAKPLE